MKVDQHTYLTTLKRYSVCQVSSCRFMVIALQSFTLFFYIIRLPKRKRSRGMHLSMKKIRRNTGTEIKYVFTFLRLFFFFFFFFSPSHKHKKRSMQSLIQNGKANVKIKIGRHVLICASQGYQQVHFFLSTHVRNKVAIVPLACKDDRCFLAQIFLKKKQLCPQLHQYWFSDFFGDTTVAVCLYYGHLSYISVFCLRCQRHMVRFWSYPTVHAILNQHWFNLDSTSWRWIKVDSALCQRS